MPSELYTFTTIATLSGAAFLTYLIVAYTKMYVKFSTDIYAVVVGWLVLVISQIGMGANALDWKVYVLGLFNGFLIAAVAGKSNDKAIDEQKK